MTISRRKILKSSLLGIVSVSVPNLVFASPNSIIPDDTSVSNLPSRYPSIDDAIAEQMVSAAHYDIDQAKHLLEQRPELSRATWDWGFGDWETALGAASHVGRRDIAQLLLQHGARPDIFTYALFGRFEAVKAMIEAYPHVEAITGPHGISLLSHAKAGLNTDYGISLTDEELEAGTQLIAYLEELGSANPFTENIEMSLKDKEKYLGDYRYGPGENDLLSVKLNMKKHLALGRFGKFGGALLQEEPNVFRYNGTSSITITFNLVNETITSMTISEPKLTLKAVKVN